MSRALHTLAITWADAEGLLDRTVGMLRRRQVAVKSFAVGPAALDGHSRMTILFEADAAAAERLACLFLNVVGVLTVDTMPADQAITRELVLLTLAPTPEQRAECLDTLQLFRAIILDDEGDLLTAELSGDQTFVLSCLRAVERFRVQDVARTGTAAVSRAPHRHSLPSHPPTGASA